MTPTLRTLITDAIAIIEGERELIQTSYQWRDGVVRDKEAKAELDKFDAWLERARKELESTQ
jgi:hypothetical protein